MTTETTGTLSKPEKIRRPRRMRALSRMIAYLGLRKALLTLVIVLFFVGTVSFIFLSVMLGVAVNTLSGPSTTADLYQQVMVMAGLSVLTFISYYFGYRFL
ncbi:MAG TPA: hypothetical protein PLY13_00050, partial [Methanoregulaceae archaeon]|nr:hypothetical protein [Methanoregulaceae archaeon]